MGIFAIEKTAFYALTPDDQKIVREVMSRYMGQLDRDARADNRQATEVLAKSGLQTVTVNDKDVDAWRRTIEGLHPKLRDRPDIDAALFDELLMILADYRRTHPDQAH